MRVYDSWMMDEQLGLDDKLMSGLEPFSGLRQWKETENYCPTRDIMLTVHSRVRILSVYVFKERIL